MNDARNFLIVDSYDQSDIHARADQGSSVENKCEDELYVQMDVQMELFENNSILRCLPTK